MSIFYKNFMVLIFLSSISFAQDVPQFTVVDHQTLGITPVLLDRWVQQQILIEMGGPISLIPNGGEIWKVKFT